MGYCITIDLCDVMIKKSNEQKALEALKKASGKDGFGGWTSPIDNAETLVEALDGVRYDANEEEVGDETYIVVEYFNGEKLGEDETIFNTLAPFIEDGATIYFYGEDDNKWRYSFNNGKLTEDVAEVVWPEDKEKIYRYIDSAGKCKGIVVADSEEEARDKMDIYTDKPYTLRLWEDFERKAVGDVILF